MGKIIVTEFVSLDGVMEDPMWTFDYHGPEQEKYKLDEVMAAEAQLLGRVTYEGFAAAWPSMTDEEGFADQMNRMPKYVVSSTLKTADWENSTIIRGDILAEVERLKRELAGDLLVAGSAQLVQALTKAGLVDEFRVMVFPVLLGSGKRLFQDDTSAKLRLVDTTTFPSGVIVLTYHPA